MDRPRETILSTHLQDLYVRAVCSGDLDEYRPTEASTHPYFDEAVHKVSFTDLSTLYEVLEAHISVLEKQAEKMRAQLNWEKESWTVQEAKVYSKHQKMVTDLDRLWHLRTELLELLMNRTDTFVCNAAKNLGLDLETMLKLRAQFGEDLVVVLGAGWFERQIPAEA